MMRALVIAALLAIGSTARADVFATQPLAIAGNGVAVSYERPVTERYSGVALAGYRDGADGDYDANTITLGAEVRRWFRANARMRGPYAAFHASVGHTRVSVNEMGFIGSSTSFTQRFDIGWRWVIRDHVTIAPSLGLAIHEDVSGSGRLSPIGHGMLGVGLEVGWMR
jgi:hypothetical protein